jgi:hypothetical protein
MGPFIVPGSWIGLGMARSRFPLIRTLRLTALTRRLAVAVCAAVLAYIMLLIHVFARIEALESASLGLTAAAFVAAWTAILCWRMPVFSHRTLWTFTLAWMIGLTLAVWLVLATFTVQHALGWKVPAQALAFSISLSLGGLLFRALFHRRATPVLGRFLSLLSPMLILVLIAFLWFRG